LELAVAAAHVLGQPQYALGNRVTLITGGAQPAQSCPAKVRRRDIRAFDRMQIAVVQDGCASLNEGQAAQWGAATSLFWRLVRRRRRRWRVTG
jgi:hypothetical protein